MFPNSLFFIRLVPRFRLPSTKFLTGKIENIKSFQIANGQISSLPEDIAHLDFSTRIDLLSLDGMWWIHVVVFDDLFVVLALTKHPSLIMIRLWSKLGLSAQWLEHRGASLKIFTGLSKFLCLSLTLLFLGNAFQTFPTALLFQQLRSVSFVRNNLLNLNGFTKLTALTSLALDDNRLTDFGGKLSSSPPPVFERFSHLD